MASFEVRGDTIRVVVRVPGGKKKTATFDTRKEADQWAKLQERKKQAGVLSAGPSPTVAELFEVYLDDKAGHTDTARWNEIRLLSWCPTWLGKTKVHEVTPAVINRWNRERMTIPNERTGKVRSEATVRREMNLIQGAFTYAVRSLKWITANPCNEAEKLSVGKPRNRALLSLDEIAAIKASGGYQDDAPPLTKTARVVATFLLALETGMRSGEILRLKPSDFDPAQGIVRVRADEAGGRKSSKSGRSDTSREVPLTGSARRILQCLLDSMPSDQQPTKRLLKPPYIVGLPDDTRDALWRKVRDRAGVEDLHYHDTKHEACTRLSRLVDVIELSHIVGTRDIKTIRDTYYIKNAAATAKRLPEQLSLT